MNYTYIKDIEFIKEVLNLNDQQFYEETGISRSTINNWELGKNGISDRLLERLYSFAYKNGIRLNSLKEQLFTDEKKKNETILFHGAKNELTGEIDLSKSKINNDFGKGFYLGESFLQSASYICSYPKGSVYIFSYRNDKKLKTLEYDISEDWILAIAYYRKRLEKYKNHPKIQKIIKEIERSDIVIAPIADNNMYQIIDEFINGNISDKQCIGSLSATDLGKQHVFISKRSLGCLKEIHRCYLCSEEKDDYLQRRAERSRTGIQKTKYINREYAGKGKYIEELLK